MIKMKENGDLKAALPWLKKVADNGMSDGLDNLNTAQQFDDYISAAKQCNKYVADWGKGRLAIAYNKLPDGNDKLQTARKYRYWLDVDAKDQMEKLVELDDTDATNDLYKQNHSIKTLRMAASLDKAEAQYQLGLHLLKLYKATPMWKTTKAVKGTKTNKQKAKEWFAKAAKQGHKGVIEIQK